MKDIETLSEAQINQLQRALDYEGSSSCTTPETATLTPADPVPVLTIRRKKKRSKSWTRAAHRTRIAMKRAQA